MATIVKRGGKYQAIVRRKGFPTTCRSFVSKADAKEWARHMETKADRGDLPPPVRVLDRMTVRDLIERYVTEVTIKKRCCYTETYLLNAFARQPIARLSLAQITPGHFSAYRDKRLKTKKPSTVNREISMTLSS